MMAPRTISISKPTNGVDPISPLPVRINDFPKSKIPAPDTTKTRKPVASRFMAGKSARTQGKELDDLKNKYEETKVQMETMKRQKEANNKRLLEMSGLVKKLQDIPVNYDKTAEGNNFVNVQRKIEAIMFEMDEAKKRYDELRNEKFFQNDTVHTQELQIKKMEEQIALLNERLQKEQLEQKEQQNKSAETQAANTEELEQQVMLQEMEIMNLVAEIDQLRQKKGSLHIGHQIKQQEASNAAKYAEIQEMERKLAGMKEEQDAFKMRQENLVAVSKEAQSEFVAKPTSATCDDVDKLKDDLAQFRLQQEKIGTPKKPQISNKSQPWNTDMEWKERTEMDLVTKIDVESESGVSEADENPLSLPSLMDTKEPVLVTSARRTTVSAFGVTDQSVSESTENTQPVVEDSENEPEIEIQKTKTMDSNSDTSATAESVPSISDDDAATKSDDESVVSLKETNMVELMHSDDGSIEAVSYTRKSTKSVSSQMDDGTVSTHSHRSSMSESTRDSNTCSDSGSSVSTESEGSSHGASSGGSSSGIYSSEASSQSSSRSILEQIPEGVETDDSDSESESSKRAAEKKAKMVKAGSLILRKQLEVAQSKYSELQNDYDMLLSKSKVQVNKLEEENQKLREDPALALKSLESMARLQKLEKENEKLREGQAVSLKSMANDSKEENKSQWLKQENKMLLKSLEKQNDVLDKAKKNYANLKDEHSKIIEQLADKKQRYDQLILDFSKLSGKGNQSKDFNRLKSLHDTVVLKLADMGEENDRLEKERDSAIDEIENKDVQIRAYDEAIASLNKTEYDLKQLENVHEETVIELQELTDKNKELKDMYDKEAANAVFSEKMQQDFIKAKTEMDLLKALNNEYKGNEEKLNTSEVKVAMLEGEAKKMKEKLLATKKKSKTRADQMKDIITQYKEMKTDYSNKCAELERMERAMGGLDSSEGMKEIKEMEQILQKAEKEAAEALQGKLARENDLKIVLQHYEKLQQKYEKLKMQMDSKPFDESSNGSQSQSFDLKELKKVDPVSTEEKKEDSASTEAVDNLKKQLKETKESITWKDDKIALTLTQLKAAREDITALETEKKDLEVELSEVKSKLLLARKEAQNAENKQGSGQDKLRSAISKHHQLQTTYDSLLKKFNDTRGELNKAKNNLNVKDQEEKHARKRAATIHTQYKKLQEDHNVVVQRLEKLKDEITTK